MTRSVKDLRELICVSRLSIRDDDDDDYDLSRPLSSLSIYGERSAGLVNGNGDYLQRADVQRAQGANESVFAVPRPPSSSKGGSRLKSGKRPQSAHSKSLSEHSSFNFRKGSAPLPPVGGSSRPGSNSSSGSDRPGSGESARSNFDHVLQYLTEASITEWLERTTQMLNELTDWCNNLDHFVDFAQFWLTEFPENQRLEIYKLEISIVADELIAAFGDAYVQGKVHPSDVSGIISAILQEYPNKLCSAQGGHVFLDILDTITSQKTQIYRRLLTDTRISTRNSTYAQSLLALRAFSLLSIWSSVVHFYRRVTDQATGAEGGEKPLEKKSTGHGEPVAQQRLFKSVQKGYVSVIYYYLRNGRVKLDVRDDHGRTLTFAAVLANQSSVLHYLITKHKVALPVNEAGESGNTPLHTAANWNYVDCIQVLLTKGNADVNITNQECDNATPLHVAVMQGHVEATKMLVSAGANVTANMNGITPLQLATDMGHGEIRKLLLTKSRLGDYHDEAMDVADGDYDA
ncbi:uncharacterized protein LOC129269532 [Lytechinus pictus]|uniref:uncharacterized protein LOC129269532 n=1 Tax=Lytechinus pictus TaxID=7653 RepID=UPI0030B9C630